MSCAIGVAAGSARAQGQKQTGRYVAIVVAGDPEDAALLEAVIDELLGRLAVMPQTAHQTEFDLRDVVTPRPEARELVARVWFDLRAKQEATIYLADRSWEHILVRRVRLTRGLDEIAREELGHILAAATETLLTGGRVGRPREEVRTALGVTALPAPSTKPAPKPDRLSTSSSAPAAPVFPAIALGAFWDVQALSATETLTHGPGAYVALFARGAPLRPGGRLSLTYRLPVTTEGGPIGATIDALAARLLAGLDLSATTWLCLRPAVGVGFDLVHVAPEAYADAVTLDAARWIAVPFVRAHLTGAVPLGGPRWSLELGAGVDVDLVDTEFYADRRGQRAIVLDPWTVRPSGHLGVSFQP
jgi:hypothetical protein